MSKNNLVASDLLILNVAKVTNYNNRGQTLNAVTFTAFGLTYELSSFDGGAVDLYIKNTDGVFMARGLIGHYTPPARKFEGSIYATFKAAWSKNQRSKRAASVFLTSCQAR